jgi:hypothetical protein
MMGGGGEDGKEGRFTEAVCGLDLTGLDIEALALDRIQNSCSIAALAIPLDDLPGLHSGVDDVRRQQPPMQQRLWARTRVTFAHIGADHTARTSAWRLRPALSFM